MLSFRDGDGRGAEGIIAYECIPKAKFRWESDDRNFKTSKSWRTKQNLNHNFVSYSDHTPRCGLRSSHQDAWSCPRPCLVLPVELHMTLVFQRHSKHFFVVTFRDTLETKKVNRPKQSKVTAAHCPNVPLAAPVAQQRWQSQTWPAAGSGSPRSTWPPKLRSCPGSKSKGIGKLSRSRQLNPLN